MTAVYGVGSNRPELDVSRATGEHYGALCCSTGISATTTPSSMSGEQRTQLAVLAFALVMAMSTWFSTAAVLGQLEEAWTLSRTEASWLTIVVQLGFVVGAALSAGLGIADRVGPRRLLLAGTAGAAIANALLVFVSGFWPALLIRFMTGSFLAAVYPPALKAMSSWFRSGRGLALGVMVGALTLGSALPHLLNGVGGLDWRATILLASALTLAGGVLAETAGRDGPHVPPRSPVSLTQLGEIIGNSEFRLATAGYFGHMWELYALWAWAAAFYGDVFSSNRAASFAAFGLIGSGAAGSIYAGLLSDRTSRAAAAGLAMRWSAAAALVTGFLVSLPWPIVMAAGLIWGFWVVADSAQFSTIVTETIPRHLVGTALTMQLASGFVLTVFSIFFVPVVRDAAGWGVAFAMLAPGPVLGAIAMGRLDRRKTNGARPDATNRSR